MEQRDGRSELLRSVLQEFPPVQHAVAYGSGVFAQPGLYSKAHANGIVPNSPMIDLIFAVEDPLQWHRQVCILAAFTCAMPGDVASITFRPHLTHSLALYVEPGAPQLALLPDWQPGRLGSLCGG